MLSTPSGPRALVFNVLLLLPALAAVDQDTKAPERPAAEVGEDPQRDTAGAAAQGQTWKRPISAYEEIGRKPPATKVEIGALKFIRR